MTADVARLLGEADRAFAAHDLARARDLLAAAGAARPDDPAIFLRLASVARAAGQPRAAIDAVRRALAIAPLDFAALMMHARLLEGVDEARAGEAWGHAIAQKPAGPLPPHLIAALTQGEQRHDAWRNARERRLEAGMADAEGRADAAERRRIARFRSNALRRTRPFHSEPTDYFFPELAEREFHPRDRFPWLAGLERETDTIAAELEAVVAAEGRECVPYVQYEAHMPLRQWQPLNRNADWSAIHLLRNGRPVPANARHCPRTLALLDRIGQPAIPGASPNAMFSLLAPGTAIPPHVGISNARLVCHLPLVVPEGCWFRVGGETRPWRRGEAFVFDDTIEHEALNPSDRVRIVFIFDLWHPDLSAVEREAVTALIAADGERPGTGL